LVEQDGVTGDEVLSMPWAICDIEGTSRRSDDLQLLVFGSRSEREMALSRLTMNACGDDRDAILPWPVFDDNWIISTTDETTSIALVDGMEAEGGEVICG